MMQVTISEMTFGRYGLGRYGSKVVMVPVTAPGDIVEVEPVHEHKDYVEGRVVRTLHSTSHRRVPPCRFFPRCGGCDWQHITYKSQLIFKGRLVAQSFSRSLGIAVDPDTVVEPAPYEFGYRSRVRFKVDSAGRVGLYEAASHRVVTIDRCLIAKEVIGGELAQRLTSMLGSGLREIMLSADSSRLVATAYFDRRMKSEDIGRAANFLANETALTGIILRDGRRREVVGCSFITVPVEEGLFLEVDADCFSQINHEMNPRLVQHVIRVGNFQDGVRMLDLYCGAGNFSFAAARRGVQVIGVENDPIAVACAEQNGRRLAMPNVKFMALPAERALKFLVASGYRPDVVILDPPRGGAGEIIEELIKLAPKRTVYVSCDLPTLIRDLKRLSTEGLKVNTIKAFDFFPNTHHVEVVVSLCS